MKVTLLKGNLGSGKLVELASVVARIKDTTQAKPVENMREMIPYCSPGNRVADAEKVPVVVFASGYKDQVWKHYNGLILLEFNRLANLSEARRLRDEIVRYNQPLLAMIGSSGLSVKVVVRYTLPDGTLPVDREKAICFHAHAYRRAVLHYQAQLQWQVDIKEPSLDRGCRLSYDPECFYNPEALPVRMEQPLAMPEEPGYMEQVIQSDDPLARILPGTEQRKKIEMLFETCLNQVYREHGAGWGEEEPKDFVAAVSALCFDSGVPEEDTVRWLYFRMWSLEDQNLLRLTVHNVYLARKSFGKKPCLPVPMNLLARMEEFLKRRYEFRKNEIIGEVEYREKHSFCFRFRPVTAEVLNGICLNAMEEGLDIWDKDVRRYIYSPRVPNYNPLEQFLYNLPAWDGKDRIRALADTVPTKDGEWRNRFYVWFVSMVAHWQKTDRLYANSLVPVLVGGQGISKSTFFRLLLPPVLRDYHAESINLENKSEAELLMAQNLLITIDEFDRLSKKYQADLKHLIQKPEVKVRRPHQKTFQQMRRLASFSATANPMELLTDPTGSRRYVCVQVTGAIDVSAPVEYEQLYAQAVHAIRSGERYWLNSEEEQLLTKSNAGFQDEPLEMQYLFSYFRLPEEGEKEERFTSVELLDIISERSKRKFSNTSACRFGKMLNASGIRKIHTKTGNYYCLIRKG